MGGPLLAIGGILMASLASPCWTTVAPGAPGVTTKHLPGRCQLPPEGNATSAENHGCVRSFGRAFRGCLRPGNRTLFWGPSLSHAPPCRVRGPWSRGVMPPVALRLSEPRCVSQGLRGLVASSPVAGACSPAPRGGHGAVQGRGWRTELGVHTGWSGQAHPRPLRCRRLAGGEGRS